MTTRISTLSVCTRQRSSDHLETTLSGRSTSIDSRLWRRTCATGHLALRTLCCRRATVRQCFHGEEHFFSYEVLALFHFVTFLRIFFDIVSYMKLQCLILTCTIIVCFSKTTYFSGSDRSKDHSKTKYFVGFVLILPKQKIIVQVRSHITHHMKSP